MDPSKTISVEKEGGTTNALFFERFATVLIAALAVRSFAVNLPSVFESSDTAWLVKTGELILNNGALPHGDPFSWTKTGEHWVLYQWLFEAGAGFVYQHGGLWAIGMAAALAAGAVLFLLLPFIMFKANVKAPYVFGLIALSMSNIWFWARPQLVSFLLVPVFIIVLEHLRLRGYSKWLWALPLLMVLWVNCHSFWFVGLLLIVAYLIPALAASRKEHSAETVRLASILCLSIVAVVLNPYGFALITYTLSFLQGPAFGSLYELRPLLVTDAGANLNSITYLIIASVALCAGRKHLPVQGMILSLASVAAALCFFRYIPLAILLTWPYLAIALSRFELTKNVSASVVDRIIFSRLTATLAFVSIPLLYTLQFPQAQSVWFTHSFNNRPVIEFLKKNPQLRNKMFCDSAIGCSQIISDLTPVFIDSRFDFYGKQFYENWLDCLSARGDWQAYLDGWKVGTVAIGDRYELYGKLKQSNDWSSVFDDGLNAVFVKRINDAHSLK